MIHHPPYLWRRLSSFYSTPRNGGWARRWRRPCFPGLDHRRGRRTFCRRRPRLSCSSWRAGPAAGTQCRGGPTFLQTRMNASSVPALLKKLAKLKAVKLERCWHHPGKPRLFQGVRVYSSFIQCVQKFVLFLRCLVSPLYGDRSWSPLAWCILTHSGSV